MFICAIPLISSLFTACAPLPPFATGYVEGDYVMIAPVAAAQITSLGVARGDRVHAGQVLAELERADAEIGLAQAEAALAAAQSQLADLREGRRPAEIAVIEASLAAATAQAAAASREKARQESLNTRGVTTQSMLDGARTTAETARANAAVIEANLAVARLPARSNTIAAAEAAVHGAQAARDHAAWLLSKRAVVAPSDGVVADVIRNPGEIAGPAAPVLEVLPDGAVKLRLYVAEPDLARISAGTELVVHCDGCAADLRARVSYIATGPEFTPPVIYSLQNRQKLVYLIEARPEAAGLKPGQIVDVSLP